VQSIWDQLGINKEPKDSKKYSTKKIGQEKAVTLQEEINQMEDTELVDEQIKADGNEIKVQPIQTSKHIKADGNEIEVEPI